MYLNSIWSGAAQYLISPLKVIQNRAIKIINGLPRLTPSTTLYNSSLLPLEVLNKFELALLFKKLIENRIRHTFTITRNSDIHQYNTRNVHQIYSQSVNTTKFGLKSISKRGSEIFNSIPEEIKNINILSQFKIKLKEYLFKEYIEGHKDYN